MGNLTKNFTLGTHKFCPRCRYLVPKYKFHFAVDGFTRRSLCMDCESAVTSEERRRRFANPEWKRARCRKAAEKRNRQLRLATPQWVDMAEIEKVYMFARRLTEASGEIHHVDHMVPIQHPLVCGLHVPWNLDVIPGRFNSMKSNRFKIG